VLIEDKKYACEACIKGHRSSTCKHTDRPLFEIKKKGRPVTQCEHCRELRKTKQVHVKCVCESKSDDNTTPSNPPRPKPKKATPAFPDGLPASLGAQAAAAQPSSDGSSDSDQPG
ncbi:copper-fist-domain-containing protein, partial [Stereum hirsutum FP-91666 SS1]|uniref:copper-fist-domain-containing protein n=1 Tax=Stereum hirsutum (strain FP-91666) TaxID=721885 RepID=UPI000440EAA0